MLIKFIFSLLLSICVSTSFCQYEPGFLPIFFFGRSPNARSEAMGRAYVSQMGDLGSIYFNPAGTAKANGIEFDATYTPPEAYLTKGYYQSFAIGYKVNKRFHISLSKFQFNYGKTQFANPTKTPYVENNTLTISLMPIKKLFVGVNTNYFAWQPGNGTISKALVFDLGIIKEITLGTQKNKFNIGASVRNINFAKTSTTNNNIIEVYKLPVIARIGISYCTEFVKMKLFDSSSMFKLSLQSEYQKLLNSTYRSGIKFGGEITIANLIALRGGWYNEKVFDFGFPEDNKNQISTITYGVGFIAPIKSIFKVPIQLFFDYTSLPQISYSRNTTDWGNFKTYQARIVYSLSN